MGRGELQVLVTDEHGRSLRVPRRSGRLAKSGARGLASWLRRAAPVGARGTVSIAIVSDARVRALNRTYRGRDYATDVLTFPATAAARLKSRAPNDHMRRLNVMEREALAERFLGDIVIARGVATRQAREMGHSATVELRVLALHGLLHLLGYDHERDGGRMRRLELRLLRRVGLGEGLIARARPSTSSGRAVLPRAAGRTHARGAPVEPRAAR
jgi:probable rRNA maturation factor